MIVCRALTLSFDLRRVEGDQRVVLSGIALVEVAEAWTHAVAHIPGKDQAW